MDMEKVSAIQEWNPPTNVSKLHSFLGLANYYHQVIAGYSEKAAPLTDLPKKDQQWVWSTKCHQAFDELKLFVASNPILTLPDISKPFGEQTDTFDFTLGVC